MKKYGGSNVLKKRCRLRQCQQLVDRTWIHLADGVRLVKTEEATDSVRTLSSGLEIATDKLVPCRQDLTAIRFTLSEHDNDVSVRSTMTLSAIIAGNRTSVLSTTSAPCHRKLRMQWTISVHYRQASERSQLSFCSFLSRSFLSSASSWYSVIRSLVSDIKMWQFALCQTCDEDVIMK